MKCKKCNMPVMDRGLDRCYCEPDKSIEDLLSGPNSRISIGFRARGGDSLLPAGVTSIKPNDTSKVVDGSLAEGIHPVYKPQVRRRISLGGDYDEDSSRAYNYSFPVAKKVITAKKTFLDLEQSFDYEYLKSFMSPTGIYSDCWSSQELCKLQSSEELKKAAKVSVGFVEGELWDPNKDD